MSSNEGRNSANMTTGSHIVFVDSQVDNYQALVDSSDAEIVLLDRDRDGVEQISTALYSF